MRFDTEIKGIFESAAKAVVKLVLKVDILEIKPAGTEIQELLRADFVGIIKTHKGSFLVHIEFQTSNYETRPQGMLQYAIALYRKYKLPLIQIVIYIGKEKLRMKNVFSLKTDFTEIYHRFEIIDISEIEAESFLESDEPDVFILSILGKTGDRVGVLRRVIEKLKELNLGEERILKYIHRIEVLSELRGIGKEEISEMPIEIDITKLWGYKEGREAGLKEGKEAGLKEGREIGLREGLYSAIALGLELRFGKNGLRLMKKIREISDIDRLKELKKEIIKAKSLKEFSKRIKNGGF